MENCCNYVCNKKAATTFFSSSIYNVFTTCEEKALTLILQVFPPLNVFRSKWQLNIKFTQMLVFTLSNITTPSLVPPLSHPLSPTPSLLPPLSYPSPHTILYESHISICKMPTSDMIYIPTIVQVFLNNGYTLSKKVNKKFL